MNTSSPSGIPRRENSCYPNRFKYLRSAMPSSPYKHMATTHRMTMLIITQSSLKRCDNFREEMIL